MEKELEKVAELWADQILNGRFDNGDAGHNMLGGVIRSMASKPSTHQIEQFKKTLIERCYESFVKLGHQVNLSVDYHPDVELGEACKQSGIDTSLLPVKSVVYAVAGKVSYKFGYGVPLTHVLI